MSQANGTATASEVSPVRTFRTDRQKKKLVDAAVRFAEGIAASDNFAARDLLIEVPLFHTRGLCHANR